MARRKGLTFYQKKKKINKNLITEIFSWIFWMIVAAFLAVVIVYCVGMQTNVIGSSMEPNLYNGQKIFLNRFVYRVSSPKQGDVVVFLPNGNDKSHFYVKRVVATPGDTVVIKEGYLYVNGKIVDDYFLDKIAEAGLAQNEIKLQTDEYFVIGDNCNSSEDSRSANIGPILKKHIIGKAWFKMAASSSKMGFVE